MQVRCPNCHTPIELSGDSGLSDIACPSCGSSFSLLIGEDTVPYEPGTKTIGHFALVQQIGFGTFGAVWRATDTDLDRTVAIKIPRKGRLDASETEQFLREARAAAQVRHPNIVSVHEVGREEDTVFIVSDFVEGPTLADRLTAQPFSVRETAELCAKIADALHHAHEQGVIHRDLKPGNIILDPEGEPHVMDFGLARREVGEVTMTVEGRVLGTPAYMPPEQAKGSSHTADRRSDVYSLGTILFELLTGERPFRGNVSMLIHQVINDEPPSPRKFNVNVPRDLETICVKCLEKDPGRRYATAQQLADELNRYLAGQPIVARPISTVARAWRWCKRKPALAVMIACVFFLLAGIGVVSTVAYQRTKAALASEEVERRRAETTLVDMYTTHGVSAAEQGNIQESLLWFGTAATLAEKGSDREWANRLRFRNWMRYLPVPIHAVRNPLGTVVDVVIHPDNQHALLHTDDGIVLWELSSGETLIHRDCRAAWSFDGKMLALGSPGGHVKVLAFPENQERFQIQVSGSGAPHVVFSSDGKLLAAGVQDVRVWDVDAQEFLPGEAAHPSTVASLEFACDQTCLVTSSNDRMARVFEIESVGVASSPRFAPIPHRSVDSSLSWRFFRPLIVGESHLIAGDNPLNLIDLRTGDTERSFHSPDAPILNAAVNGNGDILSISGDFRGHVHCYDLRTGERLSTIEVSRARAPGVCFRPGQNVLATIGLHSVLRFWDPRSGTRVGPELRNIGPCNVVRFSIDGTLCAIAQSDQTVKLLRMPQRTAKPDAMIQQKSKGLPFEPSIDRTGRWFVPQSARWLFASDSVRELCVYETSTGRPCSATLDLSPEILSTAISPDGTLVAAVTPLPGTSAVQQSYDRDNYWRRAGHVKIWNWQANEFAGESIQTKTLPMDCAFSPDGNELLVVCAYGHVLLINANQRKVIGKAVHPAQMLLGYRLPKRMVRFAQEGDRFLTAGFGESVCLWTSEGELLAELKHDHIVRDANFSAKSDYLVTACEDGAVTIWDAQSGEPLTAPLKHPATVHSANFGPEGKLLATGCDNGVVSVWNWRQGVRVCPDLVHTTGVYSACFGADGRLLITAAEGEVRFWERFTGQQVSSPRHANMNAPSLVINRKAQVAVASSSRGGAMHVPNLGYVFNLHELDELDVFGIRSDDLRTLAEVVSGRRVELGGSTALTTDEWWQRWESVIEYGALKHGSNHDRQAAGG